VQKFLLLACLLYGNLVFAGPVVETVAKGVKAAGRTAEELSAILKARGWKANKISKDGDTRVYIDTDAGTSMMNIEADQLRAHNFRSKDSTGKEIKNDVVDQEYRRTGKFKESWNIGGFWESSEVVETISVNRVAVAEKHWHSASVFNKGSNSKVELDLYEHNVRSKREGYVTDPHDGVWSPNPNATELKDNWERKTVSEISFEVPGKVMYQEVVEVKGNVIYQAIYKDKDDQLKAQRWLVNTDKEGKNPTIHKYGKVETVQDLGQFNLQTIGGAGSRKVPKGIR